MERSRKVLSAAPSKALAVGSHGGLSVSLGVGSHGGLSVSRNLRLFERVFCWCVLVKLKFKAICESFCRCVLGKSKFKAVCGTY